MSQQPLAYQSNKENKKKFLTSKEAQNKQLSFCLFSLFSQNNFYPKGEKSQLLNPLKEVSLQAPS